jgi:acyl carrier protein
MKQKILNQVDQVLVDYLGKPFKTKLNNNELRMDSDLKEEFDIGSIDLCMIMVALEGIYHISFDEDKTKSISETTTRENIVNTIHELISA